MPLLRPDDIVQLPGAEALDAALRDRGAGALGEAVRAPEAWAGYVLYGI